MTDNELLEYFRTAKHWNGFSTHRKSDILRLVHIAEKALKVDEIISEKYECMEEYECPLEVLDE